MTIVHVAFWGFKPECWTPCPEAPDGEAIAHKWVMGDADKHVWCMWCKAVVWHTWPNGYADAQVRKPQYCEHQRAGLGPACPQCPCHNPGGHTWQTDAAAVGVEHCRHCQSARIAPGWAPIGLVRCEPQLSGFTTTGARIIYTSGANRLGKP